MTIVGTAEVMVTANTAGMAESIKADSAGAFTQLGSDAEVAGEDAGSKLSAGAEKGTSGLKGMLANLGVPESLMTGWASAGLGIAAVGGIAIDLGEKMQTADTAIATASGSSVASAKAIGDAFLSTAGTTEFSGKEIATAYATVAGQMKATEGQTLSTSSAMTVMNAAQDLATAKQISLGTATSTLAATMQAFQLPVKDAAAATDVLFNVSNDTGQGVDAVGAALDKLKSRLGDASPPLGALGSLMVDMTNQGISGRQALSGVGTAMQSLGAAAAGTTKTGVAANAELKTFGVSATTASGQLTPMSDIIDKLGPKFDTMTQAQQIAAATTIFGATSAASMIKVIDAGPAAYDKASDSVNKMGSAHTAAATQSKTLETEFKTIEAAGEDWLTELGQLLIPVLGVLTKAITTVIGVVMSIIDWFSKASAPALAVAAAITAVLIPAFVSMAGKAAESFATMIGDAMAWVGDSLEKFGQQAAAMLGFGADKDAMVAANAADDDAMVAADEAAGEASNAALGGIGIAIGLLVIAALELKDHWTAVWGAVKTVASDAWHFIEDDVLHPIESAFDDVVNFIKTHWELLAVILLAPFAPIVAVVLLFHNQILGFFQDVVTKVEGFWDDIRSTASSLVSDIVNFFLSIPDKIGNLGKDILSKITSGLGAVGGVVTKALSFLAAGGIVTSPTLAVVGEAGPEAVIPLSNLPASVASGGAVTPLPAGGSSIGTPAVGTPSFGSTAGSSPLVGGDMNIIVQGANLSAQDVMSEAGWALKTGQFTATPAVA